MSRLPKEVRAINWTFTQGGRMLCHTIIFIQLLWSSIWYLQQVMGETAVINLNSNRGGIAVNIVHGDYVVLPSDYWDIFQGEVLITGYERCFPTGLKIWK